MTPNEVKLQARVAELEAKNAEHVSALDMWESRLIEVEAENAQLRDDGRVTEGDIVVELKAQRDENLAHIAKLEADNAQLKADNDAFHADTEALNREYSECLRDLGVEGGMPIYKTVPALVAGNEALRAVRAILLGRVERLEKECDEARDAAGTAIMNLTNLTEAPLIRTVDALSDTADDGEAVLFAGQLFVMSERRWINTDASVMGAIMGLMDRVAELEEQQKARSTA